MLAASRLLRRLRAAGSLQPAFDLLDIWRIAVAQQALPCRRGGVGQHVGAQLVGFCRRNRFTRGVTRADQELACDRTVLRRLPRARAGYARALLKTKLATQPLPLGCHWPSRARHPLETRIGLVAAKPPTDGRELAGAAVVLLAAMLMAGGV